MSTSTLIIILMVLLVLLIPLLLSYIVYPDKKVVKELKPLIKTTGNNPVSNPHKQLTFEEIMGIFSNKKSSKEELFDAIEQLVKYHGKIHTKLGDLAHPDFKRYLSAIMALCSHPQADKHLIIALDQKLCAKNPKYTRDIDEAVNKGIAKRGF